MCLETAFVSKMNSKILNIVYFVTIFKYNYLRLANLLFVLFMTKYDCSDVRLNYLVYFRSIQTAANSVTRVYCNMPHSMVLGHKNKCDLETNSDGLDPNLESLESKKTGC